MTSFAFANCFHDGKSMQKDRGSLCLSLLFNMDVRVALVNPLRCGLASKKLNSWGKSLDNLKLTNRLDVGLILGVCSAAAFTEALISVDVKLKHSPSYIR